MASSETNESLPEKHTQPYDQRAQIEVQTYQGPERRALDRSALPSEAFIAAATRRFVGPLVNGVRQTASEDFFKVHALAFSDGTPMFRALQGPVEQAIKDAREPLSPDNFDTHFEGARQAIALQEGDHPLPNNETALQALRDLTIEQWEIIQRMTRPQALFVPVASPARYSKSFFTKCILGQEGIQWTNGNPIDYALNMRLVEQYTKETGYDTADLTIHDWKIVVAERGFHPPMGAQPAAAEIMNWQTWMTLQQIAIKDPKQPIPLDMLINNRTGRIALLAPYRSVDNDELGAAFKFNSQGGGQLTLFPYILPPNAKLTQNNKSPLQPVIRHMVTAQKAA